jgi:hypothetical protein
MAHDKTAVRTILDKVKADGRTSLTAPEGKLVCDAYGIPVPAKVSRGGGRGSSLTAWASRSC